MKHAITAVDKGSIAASVGIAAGDVLLSVNGHDISDVLDYEFFTADEHVILAVEHGDDTVEYDIEKDTYEPLGLSFSSGLMSPLRSCKNHCMFCFIDQMPKGGRSTLHVKDDDWRLSLIMGNYVTLTNVDKAEFERIIERHAAPLYVSVHSTDGELRTRMMRNPTAVLIMERLERLKAADMPFHCQVVLCPGINDGEALASTLADLASLAPSMRSLAVIPVGLTKWRDGLYPLRCLTADEAREAIRVTEATDKALFDRFGEHMAFAADELYIEAGLELPVHDRYGDYPQIENGVGLLRLFEDGFRQALDDGIPHVHVDAACGRAAFGFLSKLLAPIGIKLHPIRNDFFGETVTVSGLVTGGDIAAQLKGSLSSPTLLIPETMLRERDVVFLDGMTVNELETALGVRVIPMPAADGYEFIEKLRELG